MSDPNRDSLDLVWRLFGIALAAGAAAYPLAPQRWVAAWNIFVDRYPPSREEQKVRIARPLESSAVCSCDLGDSLSLALTVLVSQDGLHSFDPRSSSPVGSCPVVHQAEQGGGHQGASQRAG